MKRGKVFGKKQVALAALVAALAVAVWLNMKYSVGTEPKKSSENAVQTGSYLGEAQYVNSTASEETPSEEDYFLTAKKERTAARADVIEQLEDTVADAKLSDEIKAAAVEKIASVTARSETEANIESLLKAKGFEKTVAVIGDNDINIIVKAEELLESETVQIEDVATSQSGFTLGHVKIITIK